MTRLDIIKTIGEQYLVSNIENGEFSYAKALQEVGKNHLDYIKETASRKYRNLDLRFIEGDLSVLIETKQKFSSKLKEETNQLSHYVRFEKELTCNKVVAILVGLQSDEVLIWRDGSDIIDEEHCDKEDRTIRPMKEYKNILFGTRNDKISLIEHTNELNELLHYYGIREAIRSQFVGTCLLALKHGLPYEYQNASTAQIRRGIEEILSRLLDNDINKAHKIVILKEKVIDAQDVRDLKTQHFQHILNDIKSNIIPYVNDKNTMGQDLLNLFFTTFNKYVGKADKNQAFTPDHIVHFMCSAVGVNKHSIVLDPCCGSGAFLVRTMTEALSDCKTEEEKEKVKKEQIYGIEYEETAYGLATTNMLIHGDGNSNVRKGNCFEMIDDIAKTANINIVLMNPPYNAQKKHCRKEYADTWGTKTKQDPSKGFHFVYEIARKIKTGKLAVLLPMQCAIGNTDDIKSFKRKMLEENTLDAVFSLPSDIFHPGASASACCMIFHLGEAHSRTTKETFFGYYKDDGFEKRKKLGRVEKEKGIWQKTEQEWLRLFFNREVKPGLSTTKRVTANDEWLAEAYMETDYSTLTERDFEKTIRDYFSYLIKDGIQHENR